MWAQQCGECTMERGIIEANQTCAEAMQVSFPSCLSYKEGDYTLIQVPWNVCFVSQREN